MRLIEKTFTSDLYNSLSEGSFGDEVGFDEFASIDEMEDLFANKVCEIIGVDKSNADYFKFNRFELHRGTSWTDSSPWMLIDAELPNGVIFDLVTNKKEDYPTCAALDRGNLLNPYSCGLEIGRLAGDRSYKDVNFYATIDINYSWYSDHTEEDAKKMEEQVNKETSKLEYNVSNLIKNSYDDLLNILLENEYQDEELEENLKEATDEELEKLKVELRSRAEDLSVDGEIAGLSEDDINALANSIKQKGFFISNNIFTDDSDEYEWEQINMFLDNEIRDYAKERLNSSLKESEGHQITYEELEDMVAGEGKNSDAQVIFDDLGYKLRTNELLDLINSKKLTNKDDIIDFIVNSEEVDKLRQEDLSESKKPEKKDEKRVIMQQGNVTCFKENDNKFLVFENEKDNEKEYKDQDSAMNDFMQRVGVDPEGELKESVTTYNLFGDIVVLDTDNKKMIINDKEFTFDKMNEYVKLSRGANRIHKPMALLLYTDYKNGKINKWKDNIVK